MYVSSNWTDDQKTSQKKGRSLRGGVEAPLALQTLKIY